MSSTTTTQFYGLTQYIGTDKADFADNNQAFRNVDADLHQVVQDSQGFTSDIANLTERVGNLDTDLTNLSTDLDEEKAKITALQNKELSQDTEIARVERNAQDMITAYNEASATSTHAYAVGDYFIYNNVLYQATAAIAVGATIVPDTNCATTNVASELIQLNNDLLTKADKNNVPGFNTTPIHTMNNAAGAASYTPTLNCLVVCELSVTTGIDPSTGQPSQSANKTSEVTVKRNNITVAEHSVGENFYAIPYKGSITTSFECKAGDVISLSAMQGIASWIKFYELT